jgi:hypothetical protein
MLAKHGLLSFHNDLDIKEGYLKELKNDFGSEFFSWFSIAQDYEKKLGIPMELGRIAYGISVILPSRFGDINDDNTGWLADEEMRNFVISFIEAIPVGVDLSNSYKHFFLWILSDEKDGVVKYAEEDVFRQKIINVSELLKTSLLKEVSYREFIKASDSAYDSGKYIDEKNSSCYCAYRIAASAAAIAASKNDAPTDIIKKVLVYPTSNNVADLGELIIFDALQSVFYFNHYNDRETERIETNKYYPKLISKFIEILKQAK